ncbi:hypothetical protein EIP91_004929 [Steccherinum ochraceum]|uniref:Helicase ATP-binding domain-containing protein n=1 Tax=Steccherinum ochraceum TaxID=92696 RepID=A0A4V2MVW5_9APHY|nr:hypothetical protein EIP91_004929 [Steccherinum ochraceum]
MVAIDEIHLYRNYGARFVAALHLTGQAAFAVGMTATPVNTRVVDLFFIARTVRTDWAMNPLNVQLCLAAIREIRAAERKDRAAKDHLNEHLHRANSTSNADKPLVVGEVFKVTMRYIDLFKEGNLMWLFRRSCHALDSQGKSILSLQPFREALIPVRLYDAEFNALAEYAEREKFSAAWMEEETGGWMDI